MRLEEPTGGNIIFEGKDILAQSRDETKEFRKKVQLIFQDPYLSLNPRKSAGSIVGEPFLIHGVANGKERQAQTARLMEIVGLTEEHMGRYPHEFTDDMFIGFIQDMPQYIETAPVCHTDHNFFRPQVR